MTNHPVSGTTDASRAPRVEALYVHPIKSAAAVPVDILDLDDRGAVGDRRWLVVDENGLQVTARETPRMALIRPSFADADSTPGARRIVDGALWVEAPHCGRLRIDLPSTTVERTVTVWNDQLAAHDVGDEAASWFSDALGRVVRLVRLADHAQRPLKRKYAGPLPHEGRRVAFTDGAPLLLLGHASLDHLNARLVEQGGEPMPVARFRPNVLLTHTLAHEEDSWQRVQVGSVMLGIGSPCSRCVMTTVNPATAEKGIEPLRTLATYRRQDGEVMFGMNATHTAPGAIHVGDVVHPVPL